jgi:hypothetical protein
MTTAVAPTWSQEALARLSLCPGARDPRDRAADRRSFCLMHGDDQFCDSLLGLRGCRISNINVV